MKDKFTTKEYCKSSRRNEAVRNSNGPRPHWSKESTKPAFALVEIMVAIVIIGLIVSVAIFVIVQAVILITSSKQRVKASGYVQEQFNAVNQNATNNWNFVVGNTGINGSAPKYITFSNNTTLTGTLSSISSSTVNGNGTKFVSELQVGDQISDSTNSSTYFVVNSIVSDTQLTVTLSGMTGSNGDTLYKAKNSYNVSSNFQTVADEGTVYTIGFTIDQVYRDSSGNFSTNTSDTPDVHYRLLKSSASWNDPTSQPQSILSQSYISDYDTAKIVQNTNSNSTGFYDFRRGYQFNFTYVSSSGYVTLSPSASISTTNTFYSQIFDSNSTTTNYTTIDISADMYYLSGVNKTPITIKAITGNTVAAVNTASIGSFQNITCYLKPPLPSSGSLQTYSMQCDLSTLSKGEYFQYIATMAILSGAGGSIPAIRTLSIYYQ